MAQDRTPGDSQELKEALARLSRVYSTCNTYEDHGSCIVWRNCDTAKIWTRLSGEVETVENIGLAVAGAVGNCGESAFLIPNLLAAQEVGGRGLLDLDDLRLVGDAKFNHSDCLKISGLIRQVLR